MLIESWPVRRLVGGSFLFLPLLFLLLLLSGCGGLPLQSTSLLDNPPANLQRSVELAEVKFFPQRDYQCGPAALATMLQQEGINITPDELVERVYIPERKGSLQVEMIAAARHYQLIPYVIDKSMQAMLKELAAGNPVLVLQNLAFNWAPTWHYAVVMGYDLPQNQILLRSGTTQRHINSFELFERTWRRAKYWGVVMLPPDRLPATAKPHNYIASVLAQEKLGRKQVANTAYQTASKQWPHDRNTQMALANSYYALGKKQRSLQTFQNIVNKWPDFAPALNNLAHLLFEKGQYRKAHGYARSAVKHGKQPYLKNYQKTLGKIEARL